MALCFGIACESVDRSVDLECGGDQQFGGIDWWAAPVPGSMTYSFESTTGVMTAAAGSKMSAFVRADQAEMERTAALAKGNLAAEEGIAHHQAFVLAYSGRLREAKMMLDRAAELGLQVSGRDRSALYRIPLALWNALFDPMGAIAQLQLARAYALAGDMRNEGAYRAFFTLWKNADPEVRILNQAKAEYTKLSSLVE